MGAFVRPPESTRTRRSNKPRESARGRQQPRASLERRISAHRRHGGVVTDRIERPDAKSAPSGAHATCEVARRDGLAADVDRTSRSSSKVGMFGRLQTTPSHSHIRPRIALEGMTRICESISRTRAHDSSDIGGCQLSPGLTVLYTSSSHSKLCLRSQGAGRLSIETTPSCQNKRVQGVCKVRLVSFSSP